MNSSTDIDRLSIRSRPEGLPIMHQTWEKLVFLHWQFPPELLKRHIPEGLDLDLYDGSAWLGITPFTMRGVRPAFTPPIPGASSTHELNVRTYVVHDGVPGVWFFSLDAANPLAVLLARLGFSLPYYRAAMSLTQDADGSVHFTSERQSGDGRFEASWRPSGNRRPAEPESLEFFLIERYCLYAVRRTSLARTRISHKAWVIEDAELSALHSTLTSADGLPEPEGEPLVHAQVETLDVEIWSPEILPD